MAKRAQEKGRTHLSVPDFFGDFAQKEFCSPSEAGRVSLGQHCHRRHHAAAVKSDFGPPRTCLGSNMSGGTIRRPQTGADFFFAGVLSSFFFPRGIS